MAPVQSATHLATSFMVANHDKSAEEKLAMIAGIHVLVLGAGGLGCEMVKDLALEGVKQITVIDMDTIAVSNLNRQFLFREADVGRAKCEVVAEKINRRFAKQGVTCTAVFGKLQDKPAEFFAQFPVIISGLDNLEARRWLNALLHRELVQPGPNGTPDPFVAFVNGGTEGFQGSVQVIVPHHPRFGGCLDCHLDTFTEPQGVAQCTIANAPRVPAHCVQWARDVAWPREKGAGVEPDLDDAEAVQWLLERAQGWAAKHGIHGVTYGEVGRVLKNIIPAVASTNALVAASCVGHALKLCSGAGAYLNNFEQFVGAEGVAVNVNHLPRNEECVVCGSKTAQLTVDATMSLEALRQLVGSNEGLRLPGCSVAALLACGKRVELYNPGTVAHFFAENQLKTLGALRDAGMLELPGVIEVVAAKVQAAPVTVELVVGE